MTFTPFKQRVFVEISVVHIRKEKKIDHSFELYHQIPARSKELKLFVIRSNNPTFFDGIEVGGVVLLL